MEHQRPASFDWGALAEAIASEWRRQRVTMWLLVLLVPAVVGYVFAVLVLFPAPIFAGSHAVPRLIGTEVADARTVLENAGLSVGASELVAHPEAPRGTVVWQDPPPGVAVPEGAAVQLFVSSGPQRVPVPDLTGYEASFAQRLIAASGLRVARFDSTQAPVPTGVVVNTRPPAGSTLLPGSGVTLVVSVGAPTITVPNLIGLTPDEAQFTLADVGLTLGTALYRTSGVGAPGTIIGQDPAPGTLSAPGTVVNVTLARQATP